VFISRSGVQLWGDLSESDQRYAESEHETDSIRRFHNNRDVKNAWPAQSKKVRPVEVSPHDVFRAAVDLEVGGRRPEQSEAEKHTQQLMNKRMGEPHVRVRLPFHHLAMQHDPSGKFGHPDSWDLPGKDRVAREKDYAKKRTPYPPIYASNSAGSVRRQAKRGHRPTLFVANGNHRVAAAIRRGDTHIDAHVPATDWERFKAHADSWSPDES